MREIKFRGKRLDDGEWIDGNLISETDANMEVTKTFISLRLSRSKQVEGYLTSILTLYEVDPETVGQYTGLKDKNGKEVYEGDYWIARPQGMPYVVKWYETGWYLYRGETRLYENADGLSRGEVIGSIYDNPELLQGTNTATANAE